MGTERSRIQQFLDNQLTDRAQAVSLTCRPCFNLRKAEQNLCLFPAGDRDKLIYTLPLLSCTKHSMKNQREMHVKHHALLTQTLHGASPWKVSKCLMSRSHSWSGSEDKDKMPKSKCRILRCLCRGLPLHWVSITRDSDKIKAFCVK
jgi:hypothetical protein